MLIHEIHVFNVTSRVPTMWDPYVCSLDNLNVNTIFGDELENAVQSIDVKIHRSR